MKILFSLILFFVFQNLYSQNNFQTAAKDTTHKVPFDTNRIKNQTLLSNTSDIFSYDSLYIWNDKRTLSEIMDERQGFFIFDMGLGERNDLNYNGSYSSETGVFRDGIQINDNFYQGFDIQNISVNEIDQIEEISDVASFFYGINTFSKSINIITKDIFQPKPFSQLRFSQDRFGSVFADFIFSQPFSRKANVQLGITKHSIDGRYENSEFDVWRGRGRINMFFSPKFNAKFNFYLDNFDRGLNDGLVYSPVSGNLTDDSATVVNPAASENLQNYYYDATMTGRFFKNKNSLSKLILYSNNSLRHLNNYDTSFYNSGYTHSIVYGLDLSQSFAFVHSKFLKSDLLIGGNVYLNLFNGYSWYNYQNNYYSLRAKYDVTYKSLFVSALLRGDRLNDILEVQDFISAGIESKYDIYKNKDFTIALNGGINQTNYLIPSKKDHSHVIFYDQIKDFTRNFYEAGIKLIFNNLTLSGEYYGTDNKYFYTYNLNNIIHGFDDLDAKINGVNSNLTWITKYSDISVTYNYSNSQIFPTNYIKSDLAFKGLLFRGKLNLKTGINLKYYNIPFITYQSQPSYSIIPSTNAFPQQNQFIADFYVGARIGKANINITVANIFNSLVYSAYVYPMDDRGGLLNSISRFTIVWDFIN